MLTPSSETFEVWIGDYVICGCAAEDETLIWMDGLVGLNGVGVWRDGAEGDRPWQPTRPSISMFGDILRNPLSYVECEARYTYPATRYK